MSAISEIINNPTLSALVGVVVGAILGFLGQWALNHMSRKQRIKGVLQAIYEELKQTNDFLFDRQFVKDSMAEIEKDEKRIFRFFIPISQDYLTIYRSNANLIGQINDPPDLRPKIVRTYVHLQVLIEMYRANNEMLGEYQLTRDGLRGIAQALKNRHTRFQESREEVFRILKEKYNISDSVNDSP